MKNRKIIFCIVLILCSFFSVSCNSSVTDKEIYFKSVFEIICKQDGRFDSVGTGFKTKNGVYTNAHIVSYTQLDEKKVYEQISAVVYGTDTIIEMEIVKIDHVKDIAILRPKTETELFESLNALEIADSNDIYIGQEIFTIGNLNGYGLACNIGIVSSRQKNIERNGAMNKFIQTSIEISKGSSGGPVLSQEGKVIAMMTFKVRDSNGEYVDGMSFAIPSNNLDIS